MKKTEFFEISNHQLEKLCFKYFHHKLEYHWPHDAYMVCRDIRKPDPCIQEQIPDMLKIKQFEYCLEMLLIVLVHLGVLESGNYLIGCF